jgi:hypothetical protein
MSLIKAIHGRKNKFSIGDAIRRVARMNVRIRCAVEPSVAGCTPKPPQWGRSMDDYYELIAKAVKSLDLSTETTRRAIYDLARSAMLAKLRSLTPALSESDIRREQVALDEAISRAEAEASLLSPRRPESQPWPIRQDVDQRQLETSEASDLDVAALNLPPRKWAKLAALTVMTLLVLATAGLEGPGIIASLRGGPEGIAESAASDRNEPFGSSNPANPLVLQRAALYEEDQGDPAGKQYSGTVVWRTDSVSPSPGLTPHIASRADLEIPERHISARWSLRSDDDDALPASHTVELVFKLPPDDPHGGISSVPGLLMKGAESTPGVALAGVVVKAAPNIFLISLSTADADVQRNVQLMKERSWFDIPVAFDDGRRAIIAVEKGPAGERAFSEAFAAWEQ